jgi:diacylglycerol kinase (ATP)
MLIAVAVNPRASFGRTRHAGKESAGRFRAAGAEVLLLCADSYAGLAQVVEDALESGVDALVVVGGDGMVHLGFNALAGAGCRVPLGIIPTGTGNDVARALGLPLHNLPAACDRALAYLADDGRMIDAGKITAGGTSRWFAGVVSAGFDAAVNEMTATWTCSLSASCPGPGCWPCSRKCLPASTWATPPCSFAGSARWNWRPATSWPTPTASGSGRSR